MAVDNIYSAIIKLLSQNTDISSQLAHYPNSTIPIIQAGTLAETVTGLPCLTLRSEFMSELNKVHGEESFIVNCFAENEIESTSLARLIIQEFDDTNNTIDGFSMLLTASGLPSNGDPTAKEINTPVQMRVVYWR